jgi:hypothetical protein
MALASGENSAPLRQLQQWLDRVIASLQHPQERRIGFGNVRHEYSEWGQNEGRVTNVAIIYEIPGGSTCQVNVAYHHEDASFIYFDPQTGERTSTKDVEQVRQMIEAELQAIPTRRHESLLEQVDRWLADGLSRSDVFGQLNKLLQTEFLGGRITNKELAAAVQHVVRRVRQQAAGSPSP